MLWQPALPERYRTLSEREVSDAIDARRAQLGERVLILGHHYQQHDVIQHADLTGDSLKLSQLAAQASAERDVEFIIFCGVHFMAETADILTPDHVQVILPDLSAGCSMADMADYDDTVDAWAHLHEALDQTGRADQKIIPITYVNSSAAIKAFVGKHGGACCTSTNAAKVFQWALESEHSDAGTPPRILFLPDQHLGRNTAAKFGFITEVDERAGRGQSQCLVYDPKKDNGGVTDDAIAQARIYLWAGHCSVHKLFRPEHVHQAREQYAHRGGINILVHPECCKEVVDLADLDGSTEYIIRQIENAPPESNWAIGTEVHLVNRLAKQAAKRGVHVRMLSECQCLCTTMYRIDPPHLLWALDNLAEGKVVNRIGVHPDAAEYARLALDRMLGMTAVTPSAQPAFID